MSNLEDRVIAEAAKLIAKSVKIDNHTVEVLVAEILASNFAHSVYGRDRKTWILKRAEERANELIVEEIMRKEVSNA